MNLALSRTVRGAAVFLLVVGLLLAAGGAKLVWLGGSPYYLLAGVTVILSAVWLWRGSPKAALAYAALLVLTWLWALHEVGLDGWQLMPRLVGPALVGLLFVLPPIGRCVGRVPALAAGGAVVLCLGTMVVAASLPGPDDVADREVAMQTVGDPGNPGEWPEFGKTLAGQRYSTLTQIDRGNVARLKVAWVYHTGIPAGGLKSGNETTPLMVGGRLFLCTQTNVVIALDPDTGHELWHYDPHLDATGASLVRACRGVAFKHLDGVTDCPDRIISANFGAQLIALDAATGRLCPSFGKGGIVDLKEGMGNVLPGEYYTSSAPIVVRGNIVVGGWVADNLGTDEPSGVIRGFDARSGKLAWAWDVGNPANKHGAAPGKWYTRSTPNSWAPMAGDEQLGLVYVPTGNPTPDFFGGQRSAADDTYGSSVVALDAATGDERWHYQTTHHDLWDYDVPAQPTLLDVTVGGRTVPALAQATKRGEIFLLDRRNGQPIGPVVERPAPQRGHAPGEHNAATQPFPVDMPSFAGPPLTERDMWGITPLDQLWCRIRFKGLRYDGEMTPPGTDESLIYPSIGGGMNWGGVAYDPERAIMLVNSFYYPTVVQLIPRAKADALIASHKGGGGSHSTDFTIPQPQAGTPFGVLQSGLISPLNVLCNAPPYGKLSAIDMRARKLLWSRPIGTTQDSGPFGLKLGVPIPMGMPGWGGQLATRSGLTFIGYVKEHAFRAFDTVTGKELWRARLPASANANPMTYVSPKSGRQFVVVAAGGHVMLQSFPLNDSIVAFALSNNAQ